MTTRRSILGVAAFALAATFLAGCASEEEPDPGLVLGTDEVDPPDEGEPIPVEGDGGIGGEGGGPVTSNLILSSDAAGADQVEVTGTCLVTDAPPTYRLDLAGGGVLTVATGDEGGSVELELEGALYRSPDGQPPVVTASEGALSVQGPAVDADAGDQRFVDAVIGLDDLPDC